MMNKPILLVLLVGALSFWPVVSYAGVFIAKEDPAVTTAEISDDLYIVGNSVSVEHRVGEDLFSAGNTVEVTGAVGQDVFAGGNSVRIDSEVGDDIIAAGNTVRLTPKRADDVMAAGSVVEIVSNDIQGSIYASGQKISISGRINGSVRAAGETVKIKSGTVINGDLITYGPNEPVLEDKVSIGGERKRIFRQPEEGLAGWEKGAVIGWMMSVVVWAAVAIVLLYLLPSLTKDVVSRALHRGGRSIGIGFMWLLAVVPLTIVLLMTVVGWPLAIIAVLSSATLMMLSYGWSMVVVGAWVMSKIQQKETKITWLQALVGVVVVKIVQLLPLVGWLIGLAALVLTAGAVGMSLWERLKAAKNEPESVIDGSGSATS